MRRIRSTDESQAVSLFPFLAVLLSTMGALLLVLVVMARQARLQAAQEEGAEAPPVLTSEPEIRSGVEPADSADLLALHETADRLQAVRQAGLTELEDSRLRLRHADHHVRQLQDEVASLYAEMRALEERDSHRLEDREQAERELERLRELIRRTETRLEEQRRSAAAAPKSYAVIPYEGPHGTKRRPLYIECRRDAVVLQPEGIELQFGDFQGPLGPGNPLASALRAAEEYYAADEAAGAAASASGGSASDRQEPYPLVLVRPDGIATYYYVRKALEGWGAEFGYELLDGDWQLEFPLPNPQVANVQQRAIDLARARQQALALAAPRRYGGGGGLADGEGSRGGGGFIGGLSAAVGAPGEGGRGWTVGEAGGEARHARDRYATSRHDDGGGGPGGGGDWGADPGNGAAATSGPSRYRPAQGQANEDPAYQGGGGGGAPDPQAAIGTDAARRGHGISPPVNANVAGRVASGAASNRYASQQGAAAAGGFPPSGAAAGGGPQSASGPAGAAAGPQAPQSAGAGSGNAGSPGASASLTPLAETRGANWALPDAAMGAVPVRRTIQVIVRHDRLALLPETGGTGGRVIPITGSLAAAIDPFVEAVGEQIEGWGTAGRGLYWQPILVMKHGPRGLPQALALRRLLAGSGLEIATP